MNAYLTAVSYYLPDHVLTNEELSKQHPEWSIQKIAAKTGIVERHIAAGTEFCSDMAVNAAEKLIEEYKIDRSEIDFLLLCTQSPDYLLPTTACIVQDQLKLGKHIGALDFNLGCSGYVYGLGLAKGLIATGQAKKLLLITSETYSKFIHPDDKSNKTLFGDAASATLICGKPLANNFNGLIGEFQYGTDGSGAEFLMVKNGGGRHKHAKGVDIFEAESFIKNDDCLYMDGKAIFNFTAFQIPSLISQTLERNNLQAEQIDHFLLHQANQFMLETIRKRAAIPTEKFIIDLAYCGNTVSATIPIALANAIRSQKIGISGRILLSGFGVGLSMAGCVLTY